MINKNTHIIDFFAEIAADLRESGMVTNIVDNLNDTYTITTDSVRSLAANDYITMQSFENCEVISVTAPDTFVVKYVTNVVFNPTAWTANKPYFEFDYYDQESARLSEKDKSVKFKRQKYPLIFLLLGISEQISEKTFTTYPGLTIILATNTNKDKDSEWRHSNTFAKFLRPLYEKFIASLNSNFYVNKQPHQIIDHEYREIFYTRFNQFNDYCDAIELNINNLQIKKFNFC